MIIDAHVHLVGEGWIHDDFFSNLSRLVAASIGKQSGEAPDPAVLTTGIKELLFDTTGDKLVRQMDEAGVDQSCIFPVDYGLLTGEPGVSIETQNKLIADAVKRHPGRLVGFFTIDPRRPRSLELFKEAIEEWGLRGLKLHSSSGWYPYDRIAYPLYEQCLEYGLPMLIHTGSQPAPMQSRFCRPIYIGDVASDYPDLQIIMAHCGMEWWEEALMVCKIKPNCHVDFSSWQREYVEDPLYFYNVLRKFIDTIGPWRVIFGSDNPYLNGILPLKEWVSAFVDPQVPGGNISFSREELEIVTGKSFAKLL